MHDYNDVSAVIMCYFNFSTSHHSIRTSQICEVLVIRTGAGKLGRSKVGLGKLGLGKPGFGKVGR